MSHIKWWCIDNGNNQRKIEPKDKQIKNEIEEQREKEKALATNGQHYKGICTKDSKYVQKSTDLKCPKNKREKSEKEKNKVNL